MKPQTAGKLILIIDDNVTNLKVAIEHLKTYGLEIIIARSGETGLERAAYAQPDLILLDVRMPGIDGFETCRRLKANENTKEIPVIFMTALTDISDKVRGFNSGAVDYVTKPLQVEELWARVNTHLTLGVLQKDMADRITELDAFAHTVAHDLKNPLGRVMTGLEFLKELATPQLDEEMQSILHICLNGSHQMEQIIEELLLLASVRQNEVPLEVLQMEEIVHAAKEQLAHIIEERGAEIILPDSWPTAVGYAPWIEEVWANYLSNGLKYGGKPPRLRLGGEELEEGSVRFWVRDNGAGLSAQEQTKLFQAFSRVHSQAIQGHGLGLSIVGRIVRRLGGQAGVESEPGSGSIFYFTLPNLAHISNQAREQNDRF